MFDALLFVANVVCSIWLRIAVLVHSNRIHHHLFASHKLFKMNYFFCFAVIMNFNKLNWSTHTTFIVHLCAADLRMPCTWWIFFQFICFTIFPFHFTSCFWIWIQFKKLTHLKLFKMQLKFVLNFEFCLIERVSQMWSTIISEIQWKNESLNDLQTGCYLYSYIHPLYYLFIQYYFFWKSNLYNMTILWLF